MKKLLKAIELSKTGEVSAETVNRLAIDVLLKAFHSTNCQRAKDTLGGLLAELSGGV